MTNAGTDRRQVTSILPSRFARLLDAAHQQFGAPIVLIWDNVSTHVDARMHALIDTRP